MKKQNFVITGMTCSACSSRVEKCVSALDGTSDVSVNLLTNSMRLLKLDPRVQQMLIDGTLSNGHARALLALEDGEKQFAAAQKIVQENLSVRDVERLVKSLNRIEADNPKRKTGPDISLIYKELEERLKSIMGTKVIINRKDKNKGRIEIEYYSQEELERLIELMESLHS